MTPEEYWTQFREYFSRAVKKHSKNMEDVWSSQSNRTKWYTDKIMPFIAESMKLELISEFFTVDFALADRVSHVPLIFIESENQTSKAEEEVLKLCNLSSPLKVLITCHEWDQEIKSAYLEKWLQIYSSHQTTKMQEHCLGIIVAEFARGNYIFHDAKLSGKTKCTVGESPFCNA